MDCSSGEFNQGCNLAPGSIPKVLGNLITARVFQKGHIFLVVAAPDVVESAISGGVAGIDYCGYHSTFVDQIDKVTTYFYAFVHWLSMEPTRQ